MALDNPLVASLIVWKLHCSQHDRLSECGERLDMFRLRPETATGDNIVLRSKNSAVQCQGRCSRPGSASILCASRRVLADR